MDINDLPDEYTNPLLKLYKICPSAMLRILEMLKNDAARLDHHDVIAIELGNGEKTVNLTHYVKRCAKNESVDDLRRQKTLREHENRIARFGENRLPKEPCADLIQMETRQAVCCALDILPTKLSKTAWLHWIEEMSAEEISEKLGIPIKTVYDRLSRAKTRLQGLLSRSLNPKRN